MLVTIKIWLTPSEESEILDRDLAKILGISAYTLRTRIKTLGIDHNLTYFPGPIPARCRRRARYGGSRSKLKNAKNGTRQPVTTEVAKAIVLKLILFSQRDYRLNGCASSRSFLLNENGMLEWYLESFSRIDPQAFLERMRRWVGTVEKLPAYEAIAIYGQQMGRWRLC